MEEKFDFLQKYFTIILFIPLLLGGMLQIYNLLSISPPFIRFFSASQSIADGLLILIIILYSFLLLALLTLIFWIFRKKKETIQSEGRTKDNIEKYSKKKRLFYFLFSFFGYYMYLKVVPDILKIYIPNSFAIFFMSFGPAALNFMIAAMIISFFSKSEFFIQDNPKKLSTIYIVLTLISSTLIVNLMSGNQDYLSNFKRVAQKYNCEKNKVGLAHVIYFNDKYIFIEKNCGNNKEIIIEKFDSIFE